MPRDRDQLISALDFSSALPLASECAVTGAVAVPSSEVSHLASSLVRVLGHSVP